MFAGLLIGLERRALRLRNPAADLGLVMLAGLPYLTLVVVRSIDVALYTASIVYPMDGPPIPDGAVQVEDGRVAAVGPAAELRRRMGPADTVVELPGRAIVPGLIDAHHHLSLALLYESAVDCRPERVPTLNALLAALQDAHNALSPDTWVVGYGYDEWRLPEHRHPTRAELDAACPNRPLVLIHYTYHEAVVNSWALEQLGYTRHMPDPQGGIIGRDQRGNLSGRLIEAAMAPAEGYARRTLVERTADAFIDRLASYQERLFAVGLTRIADPVVPPDLQRLYRTAREAGKLRLPVVMMPVAPGSQIHATSDWLGEQGTGEGPEELRVGPAKLFFDGAERCAVCFSLGQVVEMSALTLARAIERRSASPLRAFTRTSLSLNRHLHLEGGLSFYSQQRGLAVAHEAVERGFGVAIHAVGNRGIAQALDTLGAIRARHPRTTPPRLEHGTFITPELARRAAAASVMVVSQPHFLSLAGYEDVPPMPRGMRLFGHRTLLDAGVALAGSSDYPVADFDPLKALRTAVTRRTWSGAVLHPDEALRPEEALAMYTREAARAVGCLDVAGTLTPGKRADLAILSHDPADLAHLDQLRVIATLLAGTMVYQQMAVE